MKTSYLRLFLSLLLLIHPVLSITSGTRIRYVDDDDDEPSSGCFGGLCRLFKRRKKNKYKRMLDKSVPYRSIDMSYAFDESQGPRVASSKSFRSSEYEYIRNPYHTTSFGTFSTDESRQYRERMEDLANRKFSRL
ncbi:hypothetical protein FOZ60_008326 [Perkinsus olseni]|uniref:Uncharacterized protein n=1 Tax=Perkinsus olseni TaxID=32597 RepID=A0A7J6NK53_PEROL|nr:hypothetical protein FOZ60_008326 [Perkinsus olseni]